MHPRAANVLLNSPRETAQFQFKALRGDEKRRKSHVDPICAVGGERMERPTECHGAPQTQ